MSVGGFGGLDPAIRYRLSVAVIGPGVASADRYLDGEERHGDDIVMVRRDDLDALLDIALDGAM